jgi:fatty acid desaturase
LGIPSIAARAAVLEEEFNKMYWWSRAVLMLYLITIGIAIYTGSWLPLLYFGLPRYYGGFVQSAMIFLQHAGLKQDVWDHRENSRTIYMNPILGFLYMNMQYHVEHHIYPLIPFHQLPKLHEKIKDQLPTPYKSVWVAYKELIPVLLRQIKDPKHDINRISDSKLNIGL